LHRTVVEIRDCNLILSRYAGGRIDAAAREVTDDPELQYALRLMLAWSAKFSGDRLSAEVSEQHGQRQGGDDMGGQKRCVHRDLPSAAGRRFTTPA
jgi:hypothetical protein